jgi:hypothetical protein
MALTNAFREVMIALSSKQPQMVDQLLEDAPLLGSWPTQAASNDLHNVYEEQGTVTAAQLVNADEALPVVNSRTDLKQVDLSIIGGIIEVGEDKAKAYPGGFTGYLADKQPAIFQQTGMDLEQSILYNNIRATALANSKLQSAGGSTSGQNYSILCVRWVPGQTTLLNSPNGFGDKAMMDVEFLNGGNIYKDSNNVIVRGARYKSYVGIQLANERYVSGIANIDISDANQDNWSIPSEEDIENMLEDARANERTQIMCHPRIWRQVLSRYKASSLRTFTGDRDFNRLVDFWDSTPIWNSRNFLPGTEDPVTVS